MTMELGLHATLNTPYEHAIEKVTAALKAEGFGVLTEIDVKATLKKKLDVDFQRYVILGACNPPFAYQALQADLDIGLMLPCNVIVYETEPGQSHIAILNPLMMVGVIENESLQAVAAGVREKLDRVIMVLQA